MTLGFGTPLPEGVSAGTTAEAVVRLVDDDDTPGVVTVRPATAQVGTELTATLSDADEVAEVTGWQWHRRAPDQAAWTPVSGATAAAYRPESADAGQYLQATVRYTDGHGPDKGAASAAIGPVQATGPTERTVAFKQASYSASEGGEAATVTVRLSAAVSSGLRIPISVDPRSGPFTLAGLGTDTTLAIASGISGTFTIRADQDADRVDETVALGFRDLPSGVVAGTPSSATVTLVDDDELLIVGASDTTFAENGTGVVAAYTATDANGHTVAWSIHADGQRPANADSTHFAMGSRNGRLTFRAAPDFAAPDFEDPDDTGHDNVYLVTVQATDNGTPPASTLHDVSVTVTNVDEPGQIEFLSTRPEVGVQLLAAVTDPDGNVDVRSQQWEREDGNGGWEDVGQASERDHSPPSTYPGHATYTPVTADVGKRLRVTVGYLDGASADDQDRESAQSGETHPVVATAPPPPVRLEILGAADTTFAERTTGVVAPYRARYTDGQEPTSVTWTLSGADASDTLVIDGDDGELRFTTEPDYENPTDANLDTVYEVTVEATDAGPPAMDTTLAVSVRVTNEDDPGVVVLTTTEPRVGNPLTAVLTDQDEGVTGVHWTWLMLQPGRDSDDPRSTGSVAPTYTPVSSDAGLVLRARADYTDAHGSGKVASSSDSEPVDPRRLTVSFGSSSYEAVEGGSAETITVNMSPAADRFVRIPITFNPTSGDYSLGGLGSGHTLTFSNGDAARSFAVTAETDPDNADEEVTLGFGTPLPEEVRAGSPAGAAVTLADGAPSPPTDVRLRPASPQGHTRLTVSWTPPPEAVSGYEYRIQGSGSPPSAAASPATISGLEPGTGYRVQVRARNRYGSSGWASGSGRTNANRRPDIAGPGEESVPENTTSVADYTKSDPDGDATRWLELEGTHASRFDFSAGSLRFRTAPDYERDPHSYEVTVRATDGYDVREHEVTVTVTDVPRPEAPTASLSVPSSNGHERLDASWTVPASESPITGYELEYCYYASRDDGGPSSQDPPSDPGGTAAEERSPGICSTRPESGNSAILADLFDNTLYGVRVRATSGEGPGSWSNQATASTRRRNRAPQISGETAPSVAENSRSVGTYTKSDPDGDATRWLELGGTHASRFDFSAGSLRFRTAPDYERDPHSYEVTVRATDGYDVREHAVTVTITDVPPPPRPDVTVTVPSGNGHEQLDVRWSVSSSGATVTGWKLQYCQTNACGSTTTLTFEAGTANTTLENLRSGTRYSVRVKATSDEGDSPWSPIQRTYTRANTAPVISGPTSESIPENTTAVASYTATDAEGHSISWSLVESNSGLSISSSGRLSFDFDNAPDYESGTTAYTVTVKATDSGNPRASSTRGVTVTVTDVGPPSRMTDVRVSVPSSGTGTLNVNWTAPASGAPITGYTMEYCYYAFRADEGEAGEPSEEDLETARQAGRCTETTLGNVTSRTLTDLHRNTLYGVRMKATSGEGTGDWSTQRTATTRSAAAKALAEQMALTGLEGLAALAAPNPFNPSTTIYFQVPESGEVSLVIYSLAGQVVKTLIRGRTLKAGIYDVYWAGRDEQGRPVAAGVYFYRLTAGDQAIVRKMTMLR